MFDQDIFPRYMGFNRSFVVLDFNKLEKRMEMLYYLYQNDCIVWLYSLWAREPNRWEQCPWVYMLEKIAQYSYFEELTPHFDVFSSRGLAWQKYTVIILRGVALYTTQTQRYLLHLLHTVLLCHWKCQEVQQACLALNDKYQQQNLLIYAVSFRSWLIIQYREQSLGWNIYSLIFKHVTSVNIMAQATEVALHNSSWDANYGPVNKGSTDGLILMAAQYACAFIIQCAQ